MATKSKINIPSEIENKKFNKKIDNRYSDNEAANSLNSKNKHIKQNNLKPVSSTKEIIEYKNIYNESDLEYDSKNGARRKPSKVNYLKKTEKLVIADENHDETYMKNHDESKINEADLIEGILSNQLTEEEVIMPLEICKTELNKKPSCSQFIHSYLLGEFKKSQIKENIENEVFNYIQSVTDSMTSKILSNVIKISSDQKIANEVVDQFKEKKNKKVNINNEIRKQYMKESEANIKDLSSRIKKIEERIFILENTEFENKYLTVEQENLGNENHTYNNNNNNINSISKEAIFLKSLEHNHTYKIVKDELKLLKENKIILQNKVASITQYKNEIEEEVNQNDYSKPSKINFDFKKFLENFDKDTIEAQKKIKLLNLNKKKLLEGIKALKEKEIEKKQVEKEEAIAKEEEKAKKKEEDYKLNLKKIVAKNENVKLELLNAQKLLQEEPKYEKEYLYEEIQKKQREKEAQDRENLKFELIKKKHELKDKYKSITNEEIKEFESQIESKLKELEEERKKVRDKEITKMKQETENYMNKIREINPNKFNEKRLNDEAALKEEERLKKIEERLKRQQKLSEFLTNIPKAQINNKKQSQLLERINTIHSTSLLRLNQQQRHLLKSRSRSKRSFKRSKSPVLLYSEKLQNKSSSSNKNLKFKNPFNKKHDNNINATQSELFSDISSVKKFLQPLNTRSKFSTSNLNSMHSLPKNSKLCPTTRNSETSKLKLPWISQHGTSKTKDTDGAIHFSSNKEESLSSFSKVNRIGYSKSKSKNNLLNFESLKLKGDLMDSKCKEKEQLFKMQKEYTDEICKTQEDLADAMINSIKFKLEMLKVYK